MVGKYEIEVSNNRVSFFLEVSRKITIIQGNSGTGKSTLIRLLSEHNRFGVSSGVKVKSEKECIAYISVSWKQYIDSLSEKIIFIDGKNPFIYTKEFADTVRSSDNYFVIIVRDLLPELSYDSDAIYGIRECKDAEKCVKNNHVYNEMYKIESREEKCN